MSLSLLRPILRPFSSGELSPSLYSRTDITKYLSGLRRCRNFIVHPHGGVSNRPGTKFVAQTKYTDKASRIVRFVFNTEQAYTFEVGHHYIRFYTNQLPIEANVPDAWDNTFAYSINDYVTYGGSTYRAILDGTGNQPDSSPTYWDAQSIYEIYTPYTEDDISKLRFESSADVVYITSPDFQTRTLSRFGNADWRLELYTVDDGPFMPENITSTTLTASAVSGTATLTASSAIFNSEQVGGLFKLRHYIEGQTISQAFTGTAQSSGIKCFTTWRVISHGTWTGKFRVEKSTDGGSTWTILRTFSSTDDFNANTSGTEDIENNPDPFLVRINFYAYTSGTANIDLTTDAFYQEGIARITTFNSSTSVVATILTEIGKTTATDSWAEGSWSDYRGWPAVCRFIQDRLDFAGTYSEPMTNWMTVTGNYVSMKRHSPLLDTDGISVPLPTRQLNAINGLVALRKLVVFTSASEWTVGPVSGSGLTPTGTEQLPQGYRGSYGIEPAIVGNEVMFVQANSKVIRNLQYQLASDSFTGSDLNILARHLFSKYNIIEMAYQQDPDSIVWCLRDDGVLLGMTYMAEQEVVAWTRHDTGGFEGNPQGYIESICTIPGEGFDELWMIVRRGNYRFVERMSQRIVSSSCASGEVHQRVEDSYFVDCGVTFGLNPIRITGISNDDPVVVTAPDHGLSDGDLIKIMNVVGMTELNGNTYIVGDSTTNTFTLNEGG